MKNLSILIAFVVIAGCGSFDKKDKQLIGAGLALSIVNVNSSRYENKIEDNADNIPVTFIADGFVIVAASFLSDKGRKRLFKYWIGLKGAAIVNE